MVVNHGHFETRSLCNQSPKQCLVLGNCPQAIKYLLTAIKNDSKIEWSQPNKSTFLLSFIVQIFYLFKNIDESKIGNSPFFSII